LTTFVQVFRSVADTLDVQILVARQPIFDRTERLYGYDLILRRHGDDSAASDVPPEQLVVDTFLGIGIDQVAAGRRAFVTIDRDMLVSGVVRLLPADRVVLQFSGDIPVDAALIETCDTLTAAGYSLAIGSTAPETLDVELLRVADIIKVDAARTGPGFTARARGVAQDISRPLAGSERPPSRRTR
jgi:c-di-GMP-related signal transduction protein